MAKTVKGKQFVRQIDGGYFQDADGHYWLFSDQRGWLRASGRALAFFLCLTTKRRLLDGRKAAQ